ncbi:MAG: hypothetical protein MKZ58_03860 [Candidatus Poseidoniaceae archaeon]|nr:hypothetical protein [Candidatus Poseidoniaceae archaeon]
MAIFKLDAYVLIIRGKDRVSFVDGLSTNKIEGDCSTVFTTTAAKVIDMADVIDMGDFLALIGHGPYKENLLEHISTRILGQDITLGDASSNNSVFLSTTDIEVSNVVTKRSTWRGWLLVAPNSEKIEATMSNSEFAEYRVQNLIPHQGFEITPNVHPLACGLGELVHEAKGCYIGQEILARMRSRGRQGKELVRLANPVENATTTGKTHSLAIVRVR